ncbi:MAG: cation diffusion facilitator family transporter [Candidatus Bathyarchaeia archaeon]|jgi:cation diffusion facilitator family transporter
MQKRRERIQKRKKRADGDLSEFILLSLLKEGPLSLADLEKAMALHTVDFSRFVQHQRVNSLTVQSYCEDLTRKQLLNLNSEAKYELTQQGKASAQESEWAMEKGAAILEKQVLSPAATARNTIIGYILLSVLKMVAGFFSGSVGLIADGADTTVDTVASGIVWCGIKIKKEAVGTITIIVLMFCTAITLAFESVRSIIGNLEGTFVPMSMPYLVITVELIALASAFTFSIYQRYVGRRSQNFSLLSQSVDTKNSMYSAAAVIIGAVFSIFGIYWVDAIVGGIIAVRISIDGINLTRQIIRTLKGEKPDYSQFKLPFEKVISNRRMETYRNWVLYIVKNEKHCNRQAIVASLEKTFRPSYMPKVFSEVAMGKDFEFSENFDQIIQPLIETCYLQETEGSYCLTESGKTYLKDLIDTAKYRRGNINQKSN